MSAPLSAPRPARPQEARRISQLVAEAVDASPHYSDVFKASEKRRYSEMFLRLLIAGDPWYVCVIDDCRDIAALSITAPDAGVLWATWVYVKPEYRKSPAALSIIRTHIAHWEDNRFDKIACYVMPDNRTASTINRRLGFKDIARLEKHLFGDDVLLMERPLRKAIPGYDHDAKMRGLRLKARLTAYLAIWLRRG